MYLYFQNGKMTGYGTLIAVEEGGTYEEVSDNDPRIASFIEKQRKKITIHDLQDKLLATNQYAIEYSAGELSEEEWLPIKNQRQDIRNKISQLQKEIEEE